VLRIESFDSTESTIVIVVQYRNESQRLQQEVNTMPRTCFFATVLSLTLIFTLGAAAGEDGKWVALFDGKTIEGWTKQGGYATYEAKDGMIVGTTADGSRNTFLCKGPFSDFILDFEVLCDKDLNSGVQIRSHVYEKDTPQMSKPDRIREKGEVYGYQCEISTAASGSSGNFWDEGRRTKWLDDFSEKPEAKKAFKEGEWNHCRIIAQGDRIRSWVNGVPCADFRDDMDATGFIGLQVHGIRKDTGPYQVRWRNIRIRELKPGEKVE
jgi:hypothetical protein